MIFKKYNYIFKNNSSSIEDLEKIPAYKRMGIEIDNSKPNGEDIYSKTVLNEENKLSEMLKEVGLELESFASENSFNQSFSNGEQGKTKNKFKPADTNNSNDINDHENYTKDESLLNIKV